MRTEVPVVRRATGAEPGAEQDAATADAVAKLTRAAEQMNMDLSVFAAWVEQSVTAGPAATPPLTDEEERFFRVHSGLTERQIEDARRDGRRAEAMGRIDQHAKLLATSLTPEQAGSRFFVTADAVLRSIAKKELWSFHVDGQERIPEWQFVPAARSRRPASGRVLFEGVESSVDGPTLGFLPAFLFEEAMPQVIDGSEETLWLPLNGLEKVVPAIPEGATPVSVERFVSTPQPDLSVDGTAFTPLSWLRSGRDADSVARLVAELGTVW